MTSSSRTALGFTLCAFIFPILVPDTKAEELNWPAFRGQNGNGAVTHAQIPLTWGERQNVAWRVELPDRGNASPVVWGNRVFVAQAVEEQNRRTLMCFDAENGKLLWQSGITFEEVEPTNTQNPYCSASPATDGEHVVAYFGSAGLYCYDFNGNELWHQDFGSVDSWHGSGSSPIIHDGICYLNFGPGTEAALYACNIRTGDVIWKKEPAKQEGFRFGGPRGPRGPRPGGPGGGFRPRQRTDDSNGDSEPSTPFTNAGRSGDFSGRGGFNGSWSTPVIARVDGAEELILVESTRVAGYEPKTGEELWTFGGLPPQVFATPAIGDGVIVAMGHAIPAGTQMVAIKLGGKGDVSESHKLWEKTLRKDCIASGVVHKGNVFLIQEMGIGLCLDATNGEKKWEKRLSGKGGNGGVWASTVRVDDLLLVCNLSGDTFVIDASPDFHVQQSNFIGKETMCASPVVTSDKLFLRTYDALWCITKTTE